MLRKPSLFVLAGLLALTMAGCTYTNGYEGAERDLGTRDDNNNQTKAYGNIAGSADHNNTHLEFNQNAANVVGQMEGVHGAYVALTDKNAYVAVALDWEATGASGRGNRIDTNNRGNSEGVYDVYTGSQYAAPGQVVTDTNSYFTYPTNNVDDLSSKLKQKIAVRIRTLYPHVHNVFISANRNFLNTLSVYAAEQSMNRDVRQRLPEFNKLAAYMFSTPE